MNNNTLANRIKAIEMWESECSTREISRKLRVNRNQLSVWLRRYELYGRQSIEQEPETQFTAEQKLKIICQYERKAVSLYDICAEYNLLYNNFKSWLYKYRKYGKIALEGDRYDPPRHEKEVVMPRPKKQKPQTELERLREENEYLKAENALLKKVQTLMREKRARQQETGRKPSNH